MDPVSATLLIGTAMSAAGAITSGQAQANSMRAQARVAQANAQAVSQQAGQKQDQMLRQGQQQIGEQSASAAQSGTGMGGSNLDLIKQSGTNLAMDVLNTGYEGALGRTSYTNQAAGLRSSAQDASTAGWIGGATKLLQGASSYGMYHGYGGGGYSTAGLRRSMAGAGDIPSFG